MRYSIMHQSSCHTAQCLLPSTCVSMSSEASHLRALAVRAPPLPSAHTCSACRTACRQLHEFGELRRRYMQLYCQRLESLHEGGLVQQQQDASVASEHRVLQHGHHHHLQPPQQRRASADILAESSSYEVRTARLIGASFHIQPIVTAHCHRRYYRDTGNTPCVTVPVCKGSVTVPYEAWCSCAVTIIVLLCYDYYRGRCLFTAVLFFLAGL